MGSEKALWNKIKVCLYGLDPVRVENSAGPGTPDINCVLGWIELKHADRFPPKGGPLRLRHFTPQQRVWMLRRVRSGGRVWVLLQVGREYFLLRGDTAARHLGDIEEEELREAALASWDRIPDDLANYLRFWDPAVDDPSDNN